MAKNRTHKRKALVGFVHGLLFQHDRTGFASWKLQFYTHFAGCLDAQDRLESCNNSVHIILLKSAFT